MGVYQGDKPLSRYGKSAYQQAVEGGYKGTQEEFNALLASVGNKQDKISGMAGQVAGFDSDGNLVAQEAPSSVTAEEKAAWNAKLDSYTETDPTVPAWAKAASKPSYTASEVGARPSTWMPTASDVGAIPTSAKGAAGGVATLGADSKVPAEQLPTMDYAAKTHASQHGSGGSDPITPAAIGAAASSHNQAASTITAGTFAATGVKAATGTDYTTARLRNIQASTTDLTAGSSALANGDIYLVYE